MSGATLESWVLRWLAPRGFFAGLVLGFFVCCVLGRVAPKLAPFQDAERLHAMINPQTLYHPTALQVRAWARQQLPKDKIAVVIGGNSVLMGSGQSRADVWTRHLQAELGDEYRILNVAVSSGSPTEYGEVITEILSRDHERLVYVCNCSAKMFSRAPDGTLPVYRYFFHDARARGLLLPFVERERALAELATVRRPKDPMDELLLQTGGNRWLSFNDLWHVFGYHGLFTVWTAKAAQHPWQARKRWPDIVNMATDDKLGKRWARARQILNEVARPSTIEDWQAYRASVQSSIPEPVRPKTLAVFVRPNPVGLAKMEAESRGFLTRYDRKIEQAKLELQSCGLNAVRAGDTLDAADYMDSQHLLPSGGAKLARELAPAIRALAQRLGYVAEDLP